ncbi:Lrp/AsnC family transcriptional regulator [Anaerotardibacter muris]|uniref:Lrp/AsnC family transcriptional regulator n=1 Tax=Anaerotardibacter muris TaxID=2941505 RepID=UPI00203A6D14|nr:Lrp/AsnC family transcriptional regulator [Anaerotardibacter muris]
MPDSSKELVVRRSEWREEDIALLCGIANAGGGSLMMSPSADNSARRIKHIRKSFESIPRLSQRELGLACTTEPVMDGTELCLEIIVPAADFPLRYRNNYYLYTDGINTVVTKDILTRLFKDWQSTDHLGSSPESPENTTSPDQESSPHAPAHQLQHGSDPSIDRKVTFKERSIAAANGLNMTSTDEFILKALETNGRVTALRIAEVLGVSESTVRRSFRRLREYGFIERIGSNKAGYWRLTD